MGIGAGLAAVSAIVAVAGALEQGQAQANMADYQGQVARNNSTIANQNAQFALQSGNVQAADEGLKNRGIAGKIKANEAAGGVDVNSGSAVKVQSSQREVGLQDVQTIQSNALLRAYGYRSQATNFQAEAGLDQTEASSALEGSYFKAAGGLLGSAGNWDSIFSSGG